MKILLAENSNPERKAQIIEIEMEFCESLTIPFIKSVGRLSAYLKLLASANKEK